MKYNQFIVLLIGFALLMGAISFLITPIIAGVLGFFIVVLSSVKWSLWGGLISAAGCTGILLGSFFLLYQRISLMGMLSISLGYFLIGGGLGKYINLIFRHLYIVRAIKKLPFPFYVIDAESYRVKYSSRNFSGHNSYCYQLSHQHDNPCEQYGETCPLEEVKKHKKSTVVEHEHFNSEGNLRDYEIQCHPVTNRKGEVVEVIEYIMDITEHKLIKDELRKTEDRYRKLAESVNAILWEYDIQSDCWTYVSPKSEEILGYAPEEWTDLKFWEEHIHPDDRKWAVKYCAECTKRGEEHVFEYRFMKKDGSTAWIKDEVVVEMEEERPVTLRGFMIDLTEQKYIEKKLQESEENLRTTLNSIGDGVITTDINGQIMSMNPQAEKLTGWKLEETEDKKLDKVFRIINAQTGETVENPIRKVIKTDKIEGLANDTTLIARDGTKIQIADTAAPIKNSDGETTGIVLVFSDVTEKYRARQKLRKSEEQFRLLAENAQDIIYRISLIPEFHFDYISPAVLDITGYTPEEYYNDSNLIFKTVHPDDRAKLKEVYRGESSLDSSITLRWIRKNGDVIWGEMRNVTIEENGKLKAIEGVCRDVTEQKEVEKKLKYFSFHDMLTGLYNRNFFEEELQRLNDDRQLPISLIMVDINGLKMTNDAFGHHTGDQLLKNLADILRSSCRNEDIIARWGGDEFVILLPQTKKEVTEDISERIKNACEKSSNQPVPLSVAVGCAAKENSDQDIHDVLKAAEELMYKNKLLESRSTKNTVLEALLKALGAKSHETQEHTSRLQQMALKIGEEIGLPPSELDRLLLLSSLHDIGKISIPEKILSKPENLNENEWNRIKKHPQIGYRIAASIEEVAHVAKAILYHHEHWDGSGYPEGLEEKNIPILSRIIAIVDAYDAMVNNRPYSEPVSSEEAVEEIKRCAGSQFEPELVDIFVKLIEEQEI